VRRIEYVGYGGARAENFDTAIFKHNDLIIISHQSILMLLSAFFTKSKPYVVSPEVSRKHHF